MFPATLCGTALLDALYYRRPTTAEIESMSGTSSERAISQVHRLFNSGVLGTLTNAQLLERFVGRRDEQAEAAFEELVVRHGPLVFNVCKGLLHEMQDAEDAFQTVFLVLAHRASSIRRRASVAGWLYGVAHRVATRARRRTPPAGGRTALRRKDCRAVSAARDRSGLASPA